MLLISAVPALLSLQEKRARGHCLDNYQSVKMESKVLQTTDSLFLVSPRGLKFFLAVHDTPALSAYTAGSRQGLVHLDSTADKQSFC